jgi:putative CocE/NonD family hydrolase
VVNVRAEDVQVSEDVSFETRDGCTLMADIYRPPGSGPYPVLLRRTPYGKRMHEIGDPRILAQRGFIVVVQDIRGRHSSGGELEWIFGDPAKIRDAEDGHDTVEWLGGLAGSTGQVGTYGVSYDGWTQLQLAPTRPSHLGGIAVAGMGPDQLNMTKGIFETGRRLLWAYTFAADVRRREGRGSGPVTRNDALKDWEQKRGKWLWYLPLGDIPEYVYGGLHAPLQDHLAHTTRQSYDFRDYQQIDVPSLHITGWWDRVGGVIENYEGMVRSGPGDSRSQHRLVVGPWSHHPESFGRILGDMDHGPSAAWRMEDIVGEYYDWLFKGAENDLGSEPPIHLFITGHNRWLREEEWPLKRAKEEVLFLSNRDPSDDARRGSLSSSAPGREDADRFIYDPRDPVMSTMASDSHHAPIDQAPLDPRADILRFVSEPMLNALTVVGHVELVLWASTDGPDTDWTAKLIDVHPDGKAINVSSGIMRASYRFGYERPVPVEPGEPTQYRIKLSPVGHGFMPGHRLRLDVSSSDFPNHDRNHNTGRPFWKDAELRVAEQHVFHDDVRPSRLLIPVVSLD